MVSHFDPRTGADRSVADARLTRPVSQYGLTPSGPKTLQSTRNTMQTWEQEVAEFEMKYAKKVDEDAKILALKAIMPETLFGETGVFRGRLCNIYADLRTVIINNLGDKVPVSMMRQGSPISTTNMVQTFSTGEQGEDEEMKNEVTEDEIFAMIQQFRKGKGKGKKAVCWNCGESDHYCRDCRNDKQDNSWTDGGAWKIQKGSRAGKDAGKGWDAGKSSRNRWEKQ